ncbi:unnamed protein product [Parnassius apollo]|uniref:Carboxylic ester hydrolase n=1 Tax=Parnassius apollo TaxID=110799 RepID=A0A8S3Y9Y9_PARAO|nr:unnamed protein product [Parnassius apollo]
MKVKWFHQLTVWYLLFNWLECADLWNVFTPVIETTQGKIRGLRSISGQNRYYGIPYAVSKRFQPPKEPRKWEGVYDAVDRFRSCPQMLFSFVFGSEDCLVLDVYNPESAKPTDSLPVMVFIHGGAYYYGTKAHYDPEYLVTKNVIVVVINYRLNVLGFLCVNGISNLGLRDQVAALKWVKNNIASFGGDPDNVTLCGQSAGASAVTMHMITKFSKGLFHKVIAMSGSVFTPWAFNLEPLTPALKDAQKIAPANTEEEIYKIFMNSPLDDLMRATEDTSVNPKYFKYSPCIDFNTTDPFFYDTPYNIFKRGEFNKVPMIIGHAEVEGILFYGLTDNEFLGKLNEEFHERLPSIFSWCSEKNKKNISAILRSHYFGERRITKDFATGLVQYYSDWIIHSTHNDFLKLLTTLSDKPVYNYIFSYQGYRNFAKLISGVEMKETTHSDDVFYVFKPAGLPLLLSSSDRIFIDRLTSMITNFMKFGDPTPSPNTLLPVRWPHSNASTALRLAETLQVVSPSSGSEVFRDVLCTYGRAGHVPCESTVLCDPA